MLSQLTADQIASYYEAAQRRISIRAFRPGSASESSYAAIERAARCLSGGGVRIGLLRQAASAFGGLTGLAFKGVDAVAAFIRDRDASAFEVGYRGEAFALAVTQAGLGGCWVGGTYRRAEAGRLFGCENRETIAAVYPYGVPVKALPANPTRKRKAFDKVCRAPFDALPRWQQSAFRLGHIAPSAVNLQPWEFDVDGDDILLCPAGLKTSASEVDLGIVACHIELGAAHDGVRGQWTRENDVWRFSKDDFTDERETSER